MKQIVVKHGFWFSTNHQNSRDPYQNREHKQQWQQYLCIAPAIYQLSSSTKTHISARNMNRISEVSSIAAHNVQLHWNMIGVIVLAAGGGNAGAQSIVSSLTANHAVYIQLATILVLNSVFYTGLLVLFRHGWLFAQFRPSRNP
jgi:hypothetical protein